MIAVPAGMRVLVATKPIDSQGGGWSRGAGGRHGLVASARARRDATDCNVVRTVTY
jgi:hypothetical protein